MLRRLIHRLREAKERSPEKHDVWADFLVADIHGLTKFQRTARAMLEAGLGSLPLEVKGGKERYLTGPLPGTGATLFLYEDGAQITAPGSDWRAERWDYDTPGALIAELVGRTKGGGAI